MCPSYLATREEQHSTRGRARLLFELLNGGELRGGWRNREVEEALDLCLACKGCKGECPVNVDMATYKAEFRAHHYRRRLRPRAAYSMGLIHWWVNLAARAPRLANVLAHAPLLADVGKRIGGIAPRREIPRFAPRTFRQRWADAGGRWVDDETTHGTGPRGRVILWADTFNDHFHPQVLEAAAALLVDAGFDVVVPREGLCCGRPLYDWGFLAQAKHLMHRTIGTLRDDIRAGTPVVGLEPSCVSVFTDEGPLLVHKELDAQRLAKQTHTLTEFLASLDGYQPPRVGGRALVHGHCHDKSVLHFDQELDLLRRAGVELDVPDEGCCGMAGAFGFEAGDHYEVSLAVGERALLPAVRASDNGTPILTGGFSCREQVRQQTDRDPVHPVELLAGALSGVRSAPEDAGTARDL